MDKLAKKFSLLANEKNRRRKALKNNTTRKIGAEAGIIYRGITQVIGEVGNPLLFTALDVDYRLYQFVSIPRLSYPFVRFANT